MKCVCLEHSDNALNKHNNPAKKKKKKAQAS